MTKIPFWHTVGDAYNFTFGEWGRFFRASGAWIVLACILFVLAVGIFGAEALDTQSSFAHSRHIDLSAGLVGLFFILFNIVSNIAVAVAWHRAVLLDETPEPIRALRFRRREWRFLLYSVAVGVLFLLVFWIGVAVIAVISILLVSGSQALRDFEPEPGALLIGGPLALIGFVVLMPLAARFSLGLPAIAIEEPKGVFRRSWHRGRHNGWRLIWGPVVCSLPLSIGAAIASGGQGAMGYIVGWGGVWTVAGLLLELAFFALATSATFLGLAAAVSFLSLSFRQLTSGETLPAPPLPTAAE